jgi:hypothetical protein
VLIGFLFPLVLGRFRDLAERAHERDLRGVACGGKLFDGAPEVLRLLAQQSHPFPVLRAISDAKEL